MRKLLLRLIEWLYSLAYEPTNVDPLNKKLIRPVPGLIIDGIQYWEFVQIADMPEMRRTVYSDVRREMSMGIDDKMLLMYVDKLRAAVNEVDSETKAAKPDTARIGALLFMLEDTIKNITPMETLYNLATLHFFDRTEDLATYDLDYAERKKAAFKSFRDKSFFFSALLRTDMRSSGKSPQQDIMQSLKIEGVKLESYKRILSGQNEKRESGS